MTAQNGCHQKVMNYGNSTINTTYKLPLLTAPLSLSLTHTHAHTHTHTPQNTLLASLW